MSVPLQMSPSPSDTQAAHGSVDATQPRTGCGSDGALLPMRLACAYDRLRLSIYKRRGTRGHRIQIDRIGASTLLRFDDVGYFNTVYTQGPDVAQHLDAVEQAFSGSPFGCRLHAPSLTDSGGVADLCRARGWEPEHRYVWLSGRPLPRPAPDTSPLVIRPPRPEEATLFFRTYLRAFEAEPARVPAALDNMVWLFSEPSLYFLLAFDGPEPVGVGVLWHTGPDAVLCGGAMVPSHRGIGGHEALVAARLSLAAQLGCSSAHAWAYAGGQSHTNLSRLGLDAVATTRAWRWRSRSAS